jgi:hypothetical protein
LPRKQHKKSSQHLNKRKRRIAQKKECVQYTIENWKLFAFRIDKGFAVIALYSVVIKATILGWKMK